MIYPTFYEKDGRVYFAVPESPDLEAAIRGVVKKKSAPKSKEYYFRRGINDAAISIQRNEPRQFGTPMVELTEIFNGETLRMTCKDAKAFLADIGGTYRIRQVSGSKLPENYFKHE